MSVATRQGIRQTGARCAALIRAACILLLLAAMILTSVSGHAAHASVVPDVHAAAVDDGDTDHPGPVESDCSVHPDCHAATLPAQTAGPVVAAAPNTVLPTPICPPGRDGPALSHPPKFF